MKLFVISSTTASGKTTILNQAIKDLSVYRVITCTTRAARPCEVDGVDYYFLSIDSFNKKVADDEFIESAQVYGNYYGVLRSELDKYKIKDSFIIIDVQGAATILKKYPAAISIFIEPPPMDVIKARLLDRNTEPSELERRLSEARDEVSRMSSYKHVIKYGILEEMVSGFEMVVKSYISELH
jgi:guanylate kinase